jgi:hypothetical protein
MGLKENLYHGFQNIINKGGKQVAIKYFYHNIGSIYDDDVVLTQSGATLWTSGIVLPLNGQADGFLIEQGVLTNNDQKMYVHGSLTFVGLIGSVTQVQISLGSNDITEQYTIISDGTKRYDVQDTPIYKKVYLRRLPTGSLI